MVLKSCKLKVCVSYVQTAMIIQALHCCTKKYDANLEVSAYDMGQLLREPAKAAIIVQL